MSTFADELKDRTAEAHKRLQTTQAEMQAIQQKLSAVVQEYNSLLFLLNQENAKVQSNPPSASEATTAAASTNTVELNKTDMVRDLLQKHPGGMTPSELWREMRGQLTHRPYLYSILKRLKDKDEVLVRRKKYIARMVSNTEEGNTGTMLQ
jgi:ABC-type transporter Mla subunit MlaD